MPTLPRSYRTVVVLLSLLSAPFSHARSQDGQPTARVAQNAEQELQTGISLTQQGRFAEAIPHFLDARGHVADEYAANFNLALCYVATAQFQNALTILNSPALGAAPTPGVSNLLTQAYIGIGDDARAWKVFEQAVGQTPQNEKLYLFIADACLDSHSYDFGLRALTLGLQHIPDSSRMHYQRGVFYTFLSDADSAAADFRLAAKFGANTDVAYMAGAQNALLEGNIREAVRIAREGIQKGYNNYILLTLFGDAVARSGDNPAQPEFAEAEAALNKAISERPHYADSRAVLGELYLLQGRVSDAIARLEAARRLDPNNAAIYSHLAIAYRRKGDLTAAKQMLAALAALNQKQAAKYKDAPGGRRSGYISSAQLPHM